VWHLTYFFVMNEEINKIVVPRKKMRTKEIIFYYRKLFRIRIIELEIRFSFGLILNWWVILVLLFQFSSKVGIVNVNFVKKLGKWFNGWRSLLLLTFCSTRYTHGNCSPCSYTGRSKLEKRRIFFGWFPTFFVQWTEV
jgi:hypothetical protein